MKYICIYLYEDIYKYMHIHKYVYTYTYSCVKFSFFLVNLILLLGKGGLWH